MKAFITALTLASRYALAAPAEPLVKRASVSDVATGYASLNGGTTGGAGGTTTTVSSYAALATAIRPGNNTGIIGKDSSAKLVNFRILVKKASNVVIRNLGISKALAANGDAIGVQYSNNVWIDHVDISSDRDHDRDYYDGLLDLTHAADFITVSNSYIHDHWKASLIRHSDNNGAKYTGHLRLTQNNNYWYNINSRTPSIRFGTGHIYNRYFNEVKDGINTRDGAQVLVQSTVFVGSSKPLYSTDDRYAVATGNDLGDGSNEAEAGTLTSVPYTYSLLGSGNVTDFYLFKSSSNEERSG